MDDRHQSVHIPRTPLGAQIAEAEAIKRDLATLLRELEEQVSHRPVTTPGSWRHHPQEWNKRAGEAIR
jgi:hypothetical protein